jgi:hypothetical protein
LYIVFFVPLNLPSFGFCSLLKKTLPLYESIHLNSAPSCHDFFSFIYSVVPSFLIERVPISLVSSDTSLVYCFVLKKTCMECFQRSSCLSFRTPD